MAVTASAAQLKVRRLAPRDLDAVVAIDASLAGRSRRFYFERRLKAAQKQPDMHLQFAIDDAGALAGYVLARKLAGEFGQTDPAMRLEVIGVRPDDRGHGLGMQLLAAVEAQARAGGATSVRTGASWRNHDMLRFFDHAGFELAPSQILDCPVHAGRLGAEHEPGVAAPEHRHFSAEVDYGGARANDFEALARDRADVRSLAPGDLADLVRIDRNLMGRERRDYIGRLVDEALDDSAVRVSLTARVDGIVAGFAMARTDFGDFGRSEPVAVLDTIGVDPDYTHQHVATALLSQLFVNLEALRIEHVETLVRRENFGLLGFLYSIGFRQSQRLGFVKHLG
jgi:ribosomal protein S18 acetylase RimI-like enzyme